MRKTKQKRTTKVKMSGKIKSKNVRILLVGQLVYSLWEWSITWTPAGGLCQTDSFYIYVCVCARVCIYIHYIYTLKVSAYNRTVNLHHQTVTVNQSNKPDNRFLFSLQQTLLRMRDKAAPQRTGSLKYVQSYSLLCFTYCKTCRTVLLFTVCNSMATSVIFLLNWY